MNTPLALSAVIVAYGSSEDLIGCLRSLDGFASEIILVDMGISESVRAQIPSTLPIRIVPHERVSYVELIREKTKSYTTLPHILFLDPDEELQPELKNKIRAEWGRADAFSIARKNNIFGAWVSHSRWWPDRQIRLFKRDSVTWPQHIHSQPLLNGTVHEIEATEGCSILHHNYLSIEEYFQKAVRYAQADALERKNNNTTYQLTHAIKDGVSEFVSRYFAYEGYKDGVRGLLLSFFQMTYYFMVCAFSWEMSGRKDEPSQNLLTLPVHFFSHGLSETLFWQKKKLGLGSIKEKIIRFLLRKNT